MIRTFQAELIRLRRRRVITLAAIATVLFSLATAAIVLTSAEPARSQPGFGQGTTIESLSRAEGGTEVFTTGVSFAGTFVFVVFVGAIAVEFSRGTVRTMLLRQPRRSALLAGKLAALLTFAAALLAGAEALTWLAAKVLAPSQDIPTSQWTSLASVGHAVGDYAAALFWVAAYAVLGMTVAVLARSVPIALAVGIAWAGPFEHLLQDGWSAASRLFPGLLLEAFVAGGTQDVTMPRALVTVTAYMLVAGTVAACTFARRDVTS
jgi:ABC-2 type transport system permease protein